LPDDFADKLLKDEKERERISHSGVRPPAIDLAEQAKEKAARDEFAAKVTALEIAARQLRPVVLETGPLDRAIKAFDKCSRDSLRDWGVDPNVEDKIVRPVWTANASSWLSSDDYPKRMLFDGQQSQVKVRLLVDATGHVTKCTAISHFNLPEFNQVVCDRLTKRARFEPAELADGTKVPSYYVNLISFRIAQ
jgi:Gram-negative bacterial TonB protein C-terminal